MRKQNNLSLFTIVLLGGMALACSLSNSVRSLVSSSETSALPTSTPIPGWNKFEGEGIEIWLPGSYVGGDLSHDLDLILNNLRTLGPEFEAIIQLIEQNPELFLIFVTDSNVGISGSLTNVNITTEEILSTIDLDTYIDLAVNHFPSQFNILERKIVNLGDYKAGRLLVEFQVSGIDGKELLYIIKDETTVWILTYATGKVEFAERLKEFELSALTFRKLSR